MPTVVDSLIVTLGLDPSEFEKGQKAAAAAFLKTRDAAVKSGDDIEKSNKRAADGFDRVTKSALGLFAVLVGTSSVAEFVTGITQADAAVGRLSSNVGLSARNLQAWQAAFQRVGGTAEGASATASTANGQLMNARINGGALPQTIARLFASAGMGTTAGRDIASGDTQQYMLDLAQAYRVTAQKQGTSTAAYLLQQGGFDPSFGNLALQHGGVGMQPYLNAMPTVSDATIAQMQETQDKFVAIQQDIVANGATIVGDLEKVASPIVDELKTQVDALTSATGPMVKDIQQIAGAFNDLIKLLGPFLPALDSTDVGGDIQKRLNSGWNQFMADPLGTAMSAMGMHQATVPDSSGSTGGSLSWQNNNPGNIKAGPFASQYGATSAHNGFAVFPTYAAGRRAQYALMFGIYGGKTLAGMVNSWAPPSDGNNDDAYIADLVKRTGIAPDTALSTLDDAQRAALLNAQQAHEGWTQGRRTGWAPPPGLSQLGASAQWAALMGRGGAQASPGVTITGDIVIHTQATDGQGIANSIKPALKRTALAQHANYGPA